MLADGGSVVPHAVSCARPTTPREVLIIGAGTGNDVAVALAEGVARIDAVEIDPRLQELGREVHPNRPYDDDRVDRSHHRRSCLPRADRCDATT